MSKAEDRFFDYFLDGRLRNCNNKDAFLYGYHQAEKDLSLTIEDIERIHTFLYAVKNNKQGVFTFTRLFDEQYQEVLNRFNNLREK